MRAAAITHHHCEVDYGHHQQVERRRAISKQQRIESQGCPDDGGRRRERGGRVSTTLADTAPAASFGAPLVELQVPAGVLSLEQKAAMIKGITDVRATKQPSDPARKSFVQIFETADGGFGVNGQVFVPRGK
jgi:phenylpyruvate tautomerase PptA (4-oxalocrotonate tautomerase family)